MSSCPCYLFTPCCGNGHPVVLRQTDQNGNLVTFTSNVYQYNGIANYPDHLYAYNDSKLVPGQCYNISTIQYPCSQVTTIFVACPEASNFDETTHATCADAEKDVKCGCPSVFEFVSCCTGESTFYNVTNENGSISSGSTYYVQLELGDFTTTSCYTISSAQVEDPSILPKLDITNIDINNPLDNCENALCSLLCEPCLCYEFSGTSGIYIIVTCDLRAGQITGTIDGPVITYNGDPTPYPLTESICLRYAFEQTSGLTARAKGDCDIVYWNAEGSEINCPVYYKIVNCEDPAEQYCVSNDLSVEYSLGQAISVNGAPYAGKCWRIEVTEPCPQTVTISYTITHINCADCLSKIQTNYELLNCSDYSTVVYTSTDLSAYAETIITLNEYPDDCWYVQVLSSAIPSDIIVTPNLQFSSCEECSRPQYLLEDCDIENPDPNIITDTDLSTYVGQVVTLLNCPDKCWLVSETDPLPNPQLVNITASYQNCETCIQPAPEPTTPTYKYKSITPGYNTPGCEPDKFERIVCNFSEAMYRQIMVDAYGITPCCGEDDIKYEIKYELIKLVAIQDPDYDCSGSNTCECTTSSSGLSQQNCQQ